MSKILKNVGWLVFDKIFILLLQFFIGVKIANYYGSELYGFYSYIVAIVAFSSIFFELINGRVAKKYFSEVNYNKVVYNITLFRNGIAIILFILALLCKFFIKIDKLSYLILIFLTLDNVLITSTMGIENYYEYKLESKKVVISNNIVKFISYTLQYLGIMLNYSIVMVPAVRCIGSFIRMCILKKIYNKEYGVKEEKRSDIKLLIKLVKEGLYLWASFIALLIYTQLDKIMLGTMIGKKVVGIYAIGVLLSQILEIMIGPIQTSVFSKMIELYKQNYDKYIKFYFKCNFIITQLYIFIILCSIIIVEFTFNYVFSSEYSQAISVYKILTVAVLIKANGAFQSSHMTLKEITKKIFYKMLLGLFINMILNYFLIRKYGILGAALATSITQIITLLVADFFIKEYREQAFIQLKSFNSLYIFKIFK